MACAASDIWSDALVKYAGVSPGLPESGFFITNNEIKAFFIIVVFQVLAWYAVAAIMMNGMCCLHRNRRFALSFITSLVNGIVAVAAGLLTLGCSLEGEWMPQNASGIQALSRAYFENFLLSSSALSRFITLWFLSHCLVDMGLALVHYREEMKMDTGWVHHVFYTCLMLYVLSTDMGTGFALHLASETPTLLLAIGAVHEPWAMQDLFGLTFLLFRCIMHAVPTILYTVYMPMYPPPYLLQSLTLYMHVNFTWHWMAHRFGYRSDPAYVFPEPDERWHRLRAEGKVPPLEGEDERPSQARAVAEGESATSGGGADDEAGGSTGSKSQGTRQAVALGPNTASEAKSKQAAERSSSRARPGLRARGTVKRQ